MDFFENEPNVWETLKSDNKPIVLYGMGDGADKVLGAFERFGLSAYGVMASDDFVRGQSFHGFKVKKLSDFENELEDFNIALCFASSLEPVMNTVKSIAKRRKVLVPSVPAFGDVLFDRKFIAENGAEAEEAYSLLEDKLSRAVFVNILKFYHTGRIELLDEITTDKSEAFENILKLGDYEAYLDLGAYNGDTIDEFLHYCKGTYRKIIAVEPNIKNFSKLKAHCANMKNIELWNIGAYSENTFLNFNNKAGRNSAIADKGLKTRVAAADFILCGTAASYVKADVEGADYEVISGMKNTLKNFKPKLNFSAYHRFEDIFRLPLLIKRLNPEYKIYLRHHPYIPAWDTNLYCV